MGCPGHSGWRHTDTCPTIERERDELRAENDKLRRAFNDQSQRLQLALAENDELRAALTGVLAEADRKTDAFDRAHAALERPRG